PMELYNNPANVFVAGFIGSPQMNFIDGNRLDDPNAATIGIRPEHITVDRESGSWSGKVLHAEHLGADTILYMETDEIGLVTVRLFGQHAFDADDRLYATPQSGAMFRFDADGKIIAG
ncbi:MAG: TOBE domain-containing protein, partial [Pseudomonadota bacterium]